MNLVRLVLAEARSLLRLPEFWLMGVMPAVLLIPLMLGSITLLLSLRPDTPLVIPSTTPPVALSLDGFQTRVSDAADPAEDAILAWSREGTTYRLEARGGRAIERLESRFEDAASTHYDQLLEQAGGSRRDRYLLSWRDTTPRPPVPDRFIRQWRALPFTGWLGLSLYLGLMLAHRPVAQARSSGVAEALLVTPTPYRRLAMVRVLVHGTSWGGLAALPLFFLWMLLLFPPVDPATAVLCGLEALALLYFHTAGVLLAAELSPSVKAMETVCSLYGMVALGSLVGHLFLGTGPMVLGAPGLAHEGLRSLVQIAVPVAGTLLLTGVTGMVAERWPERMLREST